MLSLSISDLAFLPLDFCQIGRTLRLQAGNPHTVAAESPLADPHARPLLTSRSLRMVVNRLKGKGAPAPAYLFDRPKPAGGRTCERSRLRAALR